MTELGTQLYVYGDKIPTLKSAYFWLSNRRREWKKIKKKMENTISEKRDMYKENREIRIKRENIISPLYALLFNVKENR